MGHRITWRSRPRSDYPWLLRTLEIDQIGNPDPDYLIGPLSMQAVVEMLYRVSEWTSSGGGVAVPTDISMDELGIFLNMVYSGVPLDSPSFFGGSDEFSGIASIVNPPEGQEEAEIYKTGPDEFYVKGLIAFSDGTMNYTNSDAYILGSPVSTASVDIILNCGTFPVTMFSYGTGSATPFFEATGWWPFKTTAGQPAWNTTTGAAANGGPAA